MASPIDELLHPAQTNLQLYEQLARSGRSRAEQVAVHRAYELVMRIFAGQYRANGKTFIAHLVGTASILVHLEQRAQVVAAGLLHAAYSHGRFESGQDGLESHARATVRATVGAEVEALVQRYSIFAWGPEATCQLQRTFETLSALDREVLMIRLANELEDRLDRGLCYFASDDRDQLDGADVALAERAGHPELASALRQVHDDAAAAEVSPELKTERRVSFAITLAMSADRDGGDPGDNRG